MICSETRSGTPYVATSVAKFIHKTLDWARETKQCAAIVGSPGVGKTCALEQYAELHPSASFLTCRASIAGSLNSLFDALGSALGTYSVRGIAEKEANIIRAVEHSSILILDEAQNLPDKIFRSILDIYDIARIPIAFCGNPDVLKRANTDTGPYAQISRRIPRREEIYSISDADADLIASAMGVEGTDAYKILRLIAAKFHADGVVKAIQEANRYRNGSSTVRVEHLKDALESLPYLKAAWKTLDRDKRRVLSPLFAEI